MDNPNLVAFNDRIREAMKAKDRLQRAPRIEKRRAANNKNKQI
jgi:hypothetical protein